LFFIRYVACLSLVFLGSMDCLTTVVGTMFFGTKELNPLIADLVANNLPGFVVIKLAVTVLVGVVLFLAERLLLRSANTDAHSMRIAHRTLNVAYIIIFCFLVVVVLNNVLVLLRML
jgi:hypothetical protein